MIPDKYKPTLQKLSNVAIAFVVMLAWVLGTDQLLRLFMPSSYWEQPSAFLIFFMAVIMAPLWEELAFRVIPIKIASQLDAALGTKLLWPIIGLSSIMFGLGHDGYPYSLIWQGCMGVVFSYLYLKNKMCYWSNVLLHAMWNFFVIFIL